MSASYGEGMTRGIEYVATAMVLAGVWFIGSQDVTGQWLMLAAQVCWMAVSMAKGMNALLVQSVILAGLTIRAIVEWSAR